MLVGDVGATRARFGVVEPNGELKEVRILPSSKYETLRTAAADYLSGFDAGSRPARAVIAVAGPVYGDRIQMTNRDWSFSVTETCLELGLEVLEVINDFIALALSAPGLADEQTREMRAGRREGDAPIAVVGAGSGLGVSALVPAGTGWVALATEGGHRDLAASNEREWRIVERLQQRFGRVSAERALSGPGLVNLYTAICELEGKETQCAEPEEVVERSLDGSSPLCEEAVEVFSRQLGAVTADAVLTYGARGGVWLGGGVLPGMGPAFHAGLFEHGFLDKGRFRSYVEPVPVRLILDPTAALLGAARALDTDVPAGMRATGGG